MTSNSNKNVITDQELFFNENSQVEKISINNDFFYNYINKEQFNGFKWLGSDKPKTILEYGCGTGTSIEIFLKDRNPKDYYIYGVDIANKAIEKARENYPKYKFFTIKENKMPTIQEKSIDAAFMFHVLHHAKGHREIFREINSKLKVGGKFLINDLSSQNIFIRTGRQIFALMPAFIKNRFLDDLVVDGKIPEKYHLDVKETIRELKAANFEIHEVGYGHLFLFLLGWVERFIPLSKIKPLLFMYNKLQQLEKYLLKFEFFQNQAEVFYIKCTKK